MSDEQLKYFGVLVIAEPHVWRNGDVVTTAPMGHSNWTRITPTVRHKGRWEFRSMMWIRRDIKAEQVPVYSADIAAPLIRLLDRLILVVSVYVEVAKPEALLDTISKLHQLIQEIRHRVGTRIDVILAGDFNRHDQSWGGDDILPARQGEADPVIRLMDEHCLCSLLPRGTKTWQRGGYETQRQQW
jgi:hypothetical protein